MRKIALMAALALFAVSFAMAGETLRMLAVNHVVTEAMQSRLADFEKATGVKVVIDKYGEDQLTQKLITEFTAGQAGVDIFMTRPLQEGRVMLKNGFYADLKPFIDKTPGYDFEDFVATSRWATVHDGFVTAVPLVTEAHVLYYRKDLLEKNGIKVPETFDDLYAAARKLTDKQNEMYGFVARGQRSPLVTQWSSFLYSYGGDYFDPKTNKASINTPEALAAIDMYGKLLRDCGPGGVLNMSWPQAMAVFAQGKAAFCPDASVLYPNLLDPAKSTVADKTGVAKLPAGPKGNKMYNVTSWAISIYSGSKNQDAAWKFIEFMTDKAGITFIQGEKTVQCSRASVWKTPEGTKNFPADWAAAVAAAGNGVPTDKPLVTAVGQARDIIGEAVVAAIEGKDYKPVADKANAALQQLLDKEASEKK